MWENVYIVATQNDRQKREGKYSLKTTDYTQFRSLVTGGKKPYRFQDDRKRRTTHIIIAFGVNNIERFTAHVFDIVKYWKIEVIEIS